MSRRRLDRLAQGLAWLAVAIGGAATALSIVPRAHQLIHDHGRAARFTPAQSFARPGRAWSAREDVLAWAAAHLPVHARVYLQCPQPASCSNPLANWITYRLGPRVFTDVPAQARWILVYRSSLRGVSDARVQWRYGPGFAIARRS